jgi:hypothetical protein
LTTKKTLERSARAPTVAREILDYFIRHPSAEDTVEGIARWRLMQLRIENTVAETKLGLDWLVEHKFLLSDERVSAGRTFRLNPKNSAAAKRLVQPSRMAPGSS